ncbi:MAG: TetR family transcriptional regulator [Gordonia sp. (in: high G+C Gram-positive bacteria)]|uniref:TetR/AcrR family transcriptional regulator n=1 Tax=Gordonia sp. (in: high G+C Gram-positive bacteria) TaxID=84139 RepID=UPI0039E455F0
MTDSIDRRQLIVETAAALLSAGDGERLTHRRVAERAQIPLGSTTYYFTSLDDLRTAALGHLAAGVDESLAATAALIEDSDRSPEAIARLFHDYLGETEHVRADTALYVAGLQNADLAPLSRRWFSGLVDVLADTLTDRRTATSMAVFLDGAILNTVLWGKPLDLDVLTAMARSLLGPTEANDR